MNFANTIFGRHAVNIELIKDTVARRTSGYQALVFSAQPLIKGQVVQIQIDRLNPKWTSSIIIGITETNPEKLPTIPTSSLSLRNGTWVVVSDCLYENGVRTKDDFCSNLDNIQVGEVVSILLDLLGNVHLIFNGGNHLVQANIVGKVWLLVDLYGETEQITIFTGDDCPKPILSNINLLNGNMLATSTTSDKGSSKDPAYCEYFHACLRFKSSLCLPEIYFTEGAMCYCAQCIQVRGEEPLKEQGDPLEKYTIPKNWVRFPLNLDVNNSSCDQSMTGMMTNSTSSLSNVLTTWNVAYYPIKIWQVRDVCDLNGQLRLPEMYHDEGIADVTKEENRSTSKLIFSPVINYVAHDHFAIPKKWYVDSKTKQRLKCKTIFEILVKPGSYSRGPPSHSLKETNVPEKFDINHIEWSTKEQGATHVAALLLCLEGFNNSSMENRI